MTTVAGKTGYPSAIGSIKAHCPTDAIILVAVYSDSSGDTLPGVTVTITIDGKVASAITDTYGQVHFSIHAMPNGKTDFTLNLEDTTIGARKFHPERPGDLKVSRRDVKYLDLTLGPPHMEFSSVNLAAKKFFVTQGIVPVAFEVDLFENYYRGRIRLSIVKNADRERNRSGTGVNGYLSRLRLTKNADGIQDPIELPYEFNFTGQSTKFYAVGLEQGVERLRVNVIAADNFTLPATGISDEIEIECLPASVGAFRVYYAVSNDDFGLPDTEFNALLNIKRPHLDIEGNAVKVAVLDNGIFQGASLKPRILAARSFVDNDNDTYAQYVLRMDDPHGTAVTGQAAFGTKGIQFVDVRMARGQLGGSSAEIGAGIQWAIDNGVFIVTTSVGFKWNENPVSQPVAAENHALFLSTAGNNRADIPANERSRYAAPAGVLIARCNLNRESHARTPHPNTGKGDGVDIIVPGDFTNLYVPRQFKSDLNILAQQRYHVRRQEWEQIERDQAAWDARKTAWLDKFTSQKIKDRMKRAKLATEYEESVPTAGPRPMLPQQPDQPNLRSVDDDLLRDDGISFGVPIVANICAKLKLLHPALTPAQIKAILIDTSDLVNDFKNLSISRGIVNPLRAFFTAYDM